VRYSSVSEKITLWRPAAMGDFSPFDSLVFVLLGILFVVFLLWIGFRWGKMKTELQMRRNAEERERPPKL
jgi:hypothetical protein